MYEKYFNKLREECLIRNRSARTADTYINNIRHFMKWTGYKSMEDLFLQDARSFIPEKRNSGLSSATCNFYNSSICFLYKLHRPRLDHQHETPASLIFIWNYEIGRASCRERV